MPDIERERYHLERLRALLPELPREDPERPEPPDFLWNIGSSRLGIEHTRFYYPPRPGEQEFQKRQSLRDLAIELAERHHHEAGGPAVYLSAIFHDRPLSQRAARRIGRHLARSVLSLPVPASIQDPSIDVPWDLLPPEIGHAHIHGSVDGVDRLWQANRGGWVASILPDQVQAVIDRKKSKALAAREHCDQLWLLIANDMFVGGAPAQLTEQALAHTYQAAYDRVLWLQPAEGWFRELQLCAAA
jgi:hypothetical protein